MARHGGLLAAALLSAAAAAAAVTAVAARAATPMTDEATLDALRTYLRIRTDHPAPDYDAAVSHLRGLCEAAGMTTAVHTFVPGKPVLLCSRPGTTAGARSVLLNSHTDVVPAEAAKWTVDPFVAADVNGSIYARGVQDMKTIGIQYIAAVSRLPPSPGPST